MWEGEEWKGLSGLSPGCEPGRSGQQQEWRDKQVLLSVLFCPIPAQPAQTRHHSWLPQTHFIRSSQNFKIL